MKRLPLFVIFIIVLLLAVSFLSKPDTPNDTEASDDSASVPADLSNAEVYTDPEFGYEIKVPAGYKIERQSEHNILIYPHNQPLGIGPANFIYISVVPPELRQSDGTIYNYYYKDYQKLISLNEVGEIVNLSDNPQLAEWHKYTLVAIEDIGDGKVKNFENNQPWEFPPGTTENRYIYDTGVNIYILGYYTGGEGDVAHIDPRVAKAIILSFKAK